MPTTIPQDYSCEELIKLGKWAIRSVVRQIVDDAELDPDTTFQKAKLGEDEKKALRIDVNAEDTFARIVRKYNNKRFRSVHVFGEERLDDASLDLTNQKGLCVLVDALDGTDLLVRGFGNWCSAAIFFTPTNQSGSRIRAAIVGVPNGDVYYTTHDDTCVWVESKDKSVRKVYGPSSETNLHSSSICFYGQKSEGLRSINSTRLYGGPSVDGSTLRVYTLAGIPMMLKLIDRRNSKVAGVDAVFDLRGQKPHDVVPGAYLCMKAGAAMVDMKSGQRMSIDTLEESLMKPASKAHKFRYVIASTNELVDNLTSELSAIDHGVAI